MNNTFTMNRKGQRGISLIELMIGIVLSLLLLSAVIYVFLGSRQSYDTQERLARLQESGRFAMDFITQDLRRAGYLGGNADVETITGTDAADNEPACADDDAWGRRITRRAFGINDSADDYACITNYLRGDVMVVRYTESPIVETPAGTALYLRSSLFEGQIMEGDEGSTVTDEPQWIRLLAANAYYVANSGRQCSGVDIPSLWRVRLDEGRPSAPVELVPGIEQFQVQWGEDGNADGSVDQYVDADAVADWDRVIAARVWLLARSECPEGGHTDTRTYLMGDLPAYTPNDNFRRQLYVSTVQMRNRPSGADIVGGEGEDDDEEGGEDDEGEGEGLGT